MYVPGAGHSQIGPHRMLAVHVARFALLFGLYLMLAENLKWPELVMGAGAAAVAVIALGALSEHNDVHFRFDPRWLRAMWSVPLEIIVDSILVLGKLFPMLLRPRTSFGRFQRRRPQRPSESLKLPGWRAFEIAEISIAPNTYVVDIQADDHSDGRILVHQLVDRSNMRRSRLP